MTTKFRFNSQLTYFPQSSMTLATSRTTTLLLGAAAIQIFFSVSMVLHERGCPVMFSQGQTDAPVLNVFPPATDHLFPQDQTLHNDVSVITLSRDRSLRPGISPITDIESADPCDKTITTDESFWFAIPAWNDTELLRSSIQSVLKQERIGYSKINVVVFEDYGEDMLQEGDKRFYQSFEGTVDFHFIRTTFHNTLQNREKGGSAFAKWKLIEYIRDHALPHEYVFFLDGDDTLADKTVVNYLFRHLHRYKPWFAWGRHNGKYSEQCSDIDRSSLDSNMTFFAVREMVWSFCHPRMFQAHLLRSVTRSDFQRDDGSWLQKATDRPFIYRFMELAGPKRINYIGEKALYNYTFTKQNGIKVFSKDVIYGDRNLVVDRKMVKIAPSEINVVACVFKRENTEEFLESLLHSRLPPKQILNIHICNNERSRQSQLEALASKLLLRPSPRRRTITIHEMEYNMGGYARFVLSKRLMETKYVDYIMMLDDDQYVRPLSLSRIYKSREPMTYKSWYGKNWHEGETSYWKPRDPLPTDPNLRGRMQQDIETWQYGGTGMSIVDASIFRTIELFDLDYEYRFVEDVWLSYVIHQLPGWKVGRLNIKFDFPGLEFATKTGQFLGLREKKDQMFAELGYLRCHLRGDKKAHRGLSSVAVQIIGQPLLSANV